MELLLSQGADLRAVDKVCVILTTIESVIGCSSKHDVQVYLHVNVCVNIYVVCVVADSSVCIV